jgi:hypothetical protein
MADKIMGIVDIVVDGVTQLSGLDATLDPGGVTRTVVKGSKVHGYREEVQEAKLEFTIAIDDTFSIDTIRNWTNVTANFEADTGQTYSIQGGWSATPPAIGQKDGAAKCTIEGPPAEEIS